MNNLSDNEICNYIKFKEGCNSLMVTCALFAFYRLYQSNIGNLHPSDTEVILWAIGLRIVYDFITTCLAALYACILGD